MRRDLTKLADETFDLIVIGGGIFGACAAWDATQRGLKVALVERGDFCGATSANSFKLLHGGIRYLQHADLYRVRQSANARRTMIRVAPHLAHPLPIVVPTYGRGLKGKAALRAAMTIYDAATWDRNQGVADPSRHVPGSRMLPRDEVLRRYPGVSTDGLTGAGIFCDGQMHNPPRLVLAFVRTAAEHGAGAANYVEVTRFIREGDRVIGVEARDVLGDQTLTIRGRVVLNAAGPYAERLLDTDKGQSPKERTHWSRDAFFVVDRPLVEGRAALALQAVTRDPEALLSRGARHLFLVPWQSSTLVGVWHKVYHGHPDEYTVTEDELASWIAEINTAYPPANLSLDDVSLWNAGLIAFGENHDPDAQDLKFAHRSRMIDHAVENGVDGLVTLIGVRYTTGQTEAVGAVDMVFRKLGRSAPPSRSHATPLYGGDITDFDGLVEQAVADSPDGAARAAVAAMVHNHGTAYPRVLDLMRQRPELAQTIAGTNVLKAEVILACREETAQTLHDVVARRTDLGAAAYPGRPALETVAELMAEELGWDPARTRREVEQSDARFPANIRARRVEQPVEAPAARAVY